MSRPDSVGLKGVVFTRQFPNSREPLRGGFVADQVMATRGEVDWRVVAPVAWPSRHRGVPVSEIELFGGMEVAHPRYLVWPRRIMFDRVGRSMARASQTAFEDAVAAGASFAHAHELYPSGLAAVQLARESGVPLVISVHGSDLYTNLDNPRWRVLLDEAVSAAARLVCVSTGLRDDVLAELPVPEDRVVVVPNTYDDARFVLQRREERSPRVRLRIVSVGRLSPEKGFDVLLNAFALARVRGLEADLRIIGAGSEQARLEGLVSSLGISSAVELLGPLRDDALLAELASADLYCQPSRREGFGVAIVEAMATGLPVVATESGGPRDIVGESDGLLVKPGDVSALAAGLVTATERVGSFIPAEIARRAAARFGNEAVAQQLVDVYRDVVSANA